MKYQGSKQKYKSQIVPILQKIVDDHKTIAYIEPFVGGANIIDKIKCPVRIGSDADGIPITLLLQAKQDPSVFYKLPDTITKQHFYHVRDNGLFYKDWYAAAVLLFGSYNSRVYGGCYGATATTKEGKVRNYWREAIDNFKRQIPNLKGIQFRQCDYTKILPSQLVHIPCAVIYCDPPYKSGVAYAKPFDTDAFWQWVRATSEHHIVIVSEETAPDDFVEIWSHETRSHMNFANLKPKTEKMFVLKNNKWGVQ